MNKLSEQRYNQRTWRSINTSQCWRGIIGGSLSNGTVKYVFGLYKIKVTFLLQIQMCFFIITFTSYQAIISDVMDMTGLRLVVILKIKSLLEEKS